MKTWEKYTFSALAAVVTATGVAFFVMKYLMETHDPFAVVNHPLQPLMLHLHVLAAPAFLVVFGIIFNSHVGRKIGQRLPNRWSGYLSLGTLAVMTASGYLLQVVTDDGWQQLALVSHIASGVVFAGAYTVHLVISMRLWARARRAAEHRAAA